MLQTQTAIRSQQWLTEFVRGSKPVVWVQRTRRFCSKSDKETVTGKSGGTRQKATKSAAEEATEGVAAEEATAKEMSKISWADFKQAPLGSIKNWWTENSGLFRQYVRNYGGLTLTFYIGMYVVVLTTLWGLVELGAVRGPDVNKWLKNSKIKTWLSPDKELEVSPHITNFLTAWLLTKTTEPVRILVTLFAIPALLRYLPMRVLQIFNIHQRPLFARATKGAQAAGRAFRKARETMRRATGRED